MKILLVNYHPAFHLGGSEIQCDLLADAWNKEGHDVTYLALGTRTTPEDVKYKATPTNHDARSIISGIQEVAPDIIYWRCGFNALAKVAGYCRLRSIPLVFAISAARNVTLWAPRHPQPESNPFIAAARKIRSLKSGIKHRLRIESLRLVPAAISLSKTLQDSIPSGLEPDRICTIYNSMSPNPIKDFDWPRPFVFWVANLKRQKRPERLLCLADPLADLGVDIVMVGAIQQTYYEKFVAELPNNIHYLGPKTVSEVDSIMESAEVFVHTCKPEGFGNNFIQAWYQGTPTVTFEFDPDGLIEERKLGFCARGNNKTFIDSVCRLLEDEQLHGQFSENGEAIADDLFDIDQNAKLFCDFFQSLISD